jgi:hypothetical protein
MILHLNRDSRDSGMEKNLASKKSSQNVVAMEKSAGGVWP